MQSYTQKKQESARKDIEKTFEVLKQKWKVVKYVIWLWDMDIIKWMINVCIIIHNMITENQGKAIWIYNLNDIVIPIEEFVSEMTKFLAWVVDIHNNETCFNLQEPQKMCELGCGGGLVLTKIYLIIIFL